MAISNNSAVLSMGEIIVQLFNNKLMADVIFSCEDKVIFAHSFILMSRSVVYEKEFRSNQGVEKLIPIQKYDHETFYQFVRFIYTDACTITAQNVFTLLELSVKYKVPKLENEVIAFIIANEFTVTEKLQLYEFCITENYQLLRNWIQSIIGPLIPDVIKSERFQDTSPTILEAILKMDHMGTAANPVSEIDLLKAVIKWMNHYCSKNGIELSERRDKFDGLLKLIRFPVMVFAELADCVEQSNNLFTDSDFVSFFKLRSDGMWNSKARQILENYQNENLTVGGGMEVYDSYNDYSFGSARRGFYGNQQQIRNTCQLFEIYERIIICGLRIKSSGIDITDIQIKSNKTIDVLKIELSPRTTKPSTEVIVSFGESFVLNPGNQYRIQISSTDTSNITTQAVPSETKTDLVDSKFINCFKELKRDNRLIEIFFKLLENQ